VEIAAAPQRTPRAPSTLKQSGKRTWKQLWTAGRIWLGPSDEPAVRLACEQADEITALRRMAGRVDDPVKRLRFLRVLQESEKLLMQSLSSLGFTPTARARLGLVVAQAAETESRLDRFSKRGN
jgi:P27 family predicted phage terminase small subunit